MADVLRSMLKATMMTSVDEKESAWGCCPVPDVTPTCETGPLDPRGHYRSINGTHKKRSPPDRPLLIISACRTVPISQGPASVCPPLPPTTTMPALKNSKRQTVGSSTRGDGLAMEPLHVGYPMLCLPP
jgi:hypothetical protein